MKQLYGNKSAVTLFSPAALALAVALVCLGSAALAEPGRPIQGTDVGLDHDPGNVRVGTVKTDKNGAFNFDKLPVGNYKLKITGLPDQSVIVGSDGKVGGRLVEGNNANVFLQHTGSAFGNEKLPKGKSSTPIKHEHNNMRTITLVKKAYVPSDGDEGDHPSKHSYKGTVTLIRIMYRPQGGGGGEFTNKEGESISGAENIKFSMTTNNDGAFEFSNVPQGQYALSIPDHAPMQVNVGPEGKVGGNLMQFGDGMSIFDRWGNMVFETASIADQGQGGVLTSYRTAPSPKNGKDEPVKEGSGPVSFGGGGPASPGAAPSFGGMNGPSPSMILAPSIPSMGGTAGPAGPSGSGPMSPGSMNPSPAGPSGAMGPMGGPGTGAGGMKP